MSNEEKVLRGRLEALRCPFLSDVNLSGPSPLVSSYLYFEIVFLAS